MRASIVAVVVAAAGVAAFEASRERPTPPTSLATLDAANAPIAFPLEPRAVLDPHASGDAGATYRALADACLADASPYDRVINDHDRAAVAGLDRLIDATDANGTAVFDAADTVHYGDAPRVDAIARVGHAAVIAGMLERDVERKNRLFDAAFSLGMRLAEERWTWREFAAGVELMSASGAAMADAPGGRAAMVREFLDGQRDAMRSEWMPIFAAIDTRREPLIAEHNGDVFAIAASPTADRMFRVEAILKLGRMRFNIGTPPRAIDQRRATELLDALAASTVGDAALQRAVALARGLTVEQFRTMR